MNGSVTVAGESSSAFTVDYRATAIAKARAVIPLIDRLLRPEAELRQMQELREAGIAEARIVSLYPFTYEAYSECGEAALNVSLENPWLGEQLWRLEPENRVHLLPPAAQEHLRSLGLPVDGSKPRQQFAVLLGILHTLACYDFNLGEVGGVHAPTGFNWLLMQTRANEMAEMIKELELWWQIKNVRPSGKPAGGL
jgi:hypothetical protein